MRTGLIYKYTYLPTGESYIGQTTNFKKRQREHLGEDRVNLKFHNCLRKHYEDFSITILEDNILKSELNKKEINYIKKYNSLAPYGFNLTNGGDGGFEACQRYWETHPEEKRKHIERIQPLAAEGAKQWRENNPKAFQENMVKWENGSRQWREDNPELVRKNRKKAHVAAEQWRRDNPELFKQNILKGSEKLNKRTQLINTGEIFKSASEAARVMGMTSPTNISRCCRGERKSAGKDKSGNKMYWRYIDND